MWCIILDACTNTRRLPPPTPCRSCCCQGCEALAVQAIRMAHTQTGKLLAARPAPSEPLPANGVGHGDANGSSRSPPRLRRERGSPPDVAHSMARIVHAHVCLLLRTEARGPANAAALWRAQTCIAQWERLAAAGGLSRSMRGKEVEVRPVARFLRCRLAVVC